MKRLLLIAYILLLTVNIQAQQFPVQGFHLDLRIQVMKMPALKAFAKKLSENHINTLVMEWEATYPYDKHAVISNRYAYTREEIISFVKYCNGLGIDVIPLQQSFGHVEYILRHSRYKDLREDQKDYSQVNPIREEACKTLFTDLYKDLISTHTSKYIHIGGDETYLLGKGEESQQKVAKVGKGRLYGDYIKMLCEQVIALGKIPVVWADIALKYPDALKGLPAQTVFVDWNYGWDLNRFGDHSKLMESGFEIWGAPAIRSGPDNYYLTDWEKHFRNISSFVPASRQLGYKGMVITSWSTSGIYNQKFESSTEVTDLHAVRHVYPITGFDMLITAFFQSLKDTAALQTAPFIKQYWGFDDLSVQRFRQAIATNAIDVIQAKPSSVNALLDSAKQSAIILSSLKPVNNKSSLEHFILMNDIRIFYLTCILVEAEMNDVNYTVSKAPQLLRALTSLQPEKLDKRFALLNNNTLYPSEIATENKLRNERWEYLKNKLALSR